VAQSLAGCRPWTNANDGELQVDKAGGQHREPSRLVGFLLFERDTGVSSEACRDTVKRWHTLMRWGRKLSNPEGAPCAS